MSPATDQIIPLSVSLSPRCVAALGPFYEQWKEIDGWPGYEISSIGNVRKGGVEGRLLKPYLRRKYRTIAFRKNRKIYRFQVHQLVARAFISNPHGKPMVNHLNGLREDNRLENLEWCTARENVFHARYVLMRKMGVGSRGRESPIGSKITVDDVRFIRSKFPLSHFQCLADKLGIKIDSLFNVIKHKSWKNIS